MRTESAHPVTSSGGLRGDLERLAQRVQAIEQGREPGHDSDRTSAAAPVVTTGWSAVDALLPGGGLDRRGVHEWFGVGSAGEGIAGTPGTSGTPGPRCAAARGLGGGRSDGGKDAHAARFAPSSLHDAALPLALLIHLAWRAVGRGGYAVWIGRRVWPYPQALVRAGAGGRGLLERSVWVDAGGAEVERRSHDARGRRDKLPGAGFPGVGERVWAIDQALGCGAVDVVIADGSGLDMASTRRLQLSARRESDRRGSGGGVAGSGSVSAGDGATSVVSEGGGSGGALLLLARPPTELGALSAASTRWAVGAYPSPTDQPRWRVRLLRCKGAGAPLPGADVGAGMGAGMGTGTDAASGTGLRAASAAGTDAAAWVVERSHAQGDLRLSADLVDRPRATQVG